MIRYQLGLIRKKIEDLGEEEMTEKKFRGEIFEDEEKFDYGDRDILKNMRGHMRDESACNSSIRCTQQVLDHDFKYKVIHEDTHLDKYQLPRIV